jgi:hypothetical protein
LQQFVEASNLQEKEFVKELADKSENNFIYLRHALPDIVKYKTVDLKELPQGLQGYYNYHWIRMRMHEEENVKKVIVFFILVEIGEPISIEKIAKISKQDRYKVSKTLKQWYEYFREQVVEELYGFYHKTFVEFLKSMDKLGQNRPEFNLVNEKIADYNQGPRNYYLEGW